MDKPKDAGDIEVSKKTLMHISEGIYRTAGSAMKELISNSFDANANSVVISTNYPIFDIITCQDNGDGMTQKEFLRIVKGGVGDSGKSYKTEEIEKDKRPVIGRLGIGILSIAQICRSFTIISHHAASKTAFQARMIFSTEVDKIAKTTPVQEKYEIGKWELIETFEYDESKRGVLIFTKDLRRAFQKLFKPSIAIDNFAPLSFDKLLNSFYHSGRMIKEQGAYAELIWELCNLSPLPYYDGLPIREEVIHAEKTLDDKENDTSAEVFGFLDKKQKELLSYKFSAVIDGINLFRPIMLPTSLQNRYGYQQECLCFYYEFDKIVKRKPLKCYGYFFAQEMAINPRDLNGLQIRIKNVGIGMHDPTFMKYGKIESPRDKWLSGEIYVEQGLESALNIDRDSFNENDEHYFTLKESIHEFLGSVVFPAIGHSQRLRNKIRKNAYNANKYESDTKALVGILDKYFQDNVRLAEVDDIEIQKEVIRIPARIITESYSRRLAFFSTAILPLVERARQSGLGKERIENLVKDFSAIILA